MSERLRLLDLARRPKPSALAGAAAAVLLALALALTVDTVAWVLAGAVVAGLVVAAIMRPRITLVMLVLVEASNASGVVGSVQGISVYLLVLALASASLCLGLITGKVRVHWTPVLWLAAVFVAAQVPSVLMATDRSAAAESLLALTKDLWFLVVLITLALAVANAWLLARLFVATITVLSVLSLVNQFVLANTTSFGGFGVVSESTGVGVATARHAAAFDDPNFWGRLLLLAWPLALTQVAAAWQRRDTSAVLLWSGSLIALSGGVYLTQSRGALLGLCVGITVWLFLAEPRTRRMLLLLPAVVLLAAVLPGVGSRVATLAEVTDAPGSAVDYSLVERTAAQQIALAVFLDHPVTGVGLANIPAVWNQYSNRAEIIVQREVAPHNLYLQFAAESGLLGLSGLLLFGIGVCLIGGRVIAARPVPPQARAAPERLLATGVLAGLAGWSVASLFLHLSHLRPLLIVVAIIAVLDRQTARLPATEPRAAPEARNPSRVWAVRAGVVVFCLIVGTAVFTTLSQQVWVARVQVAVLPQTSGSSYGADAYEYDVVSRGTVLPTYAAVVQHTGWPSTRSTSTRALLDSGDYHAGVSVDSSASFLVVEARGPSRTTATRIAEGIADRGATRVNAEPTLSGLATATAGQPTVEQARDWSLQGLALLICGVLGALWLRGLVKLKRR